VTTKEQAEMYRLFLDSALGNPIIWVCLFYEGECRVKFFKLIFVAVLALYCFSGCELSNGSSKQSSKPEIKKTDNKSVVKTVDRKTPLSRDEIQNQINMDQIMREQFKVLLDSSQGEACLEQIEHYHRMYDALRIPCESSRRFRIGEVMYYEGKASLLVNDIKRARTAFGVGANGNIKPWAEKCRKELNKLENALK
jgi:hypothetical protein